MTQDIKQLKIYYNRQRNNLRWQRKINGQPILWQLTFEQWLLAWQQSGHLEQRGVKQGSYCLARKDLLGDYTPDNIQVIPVSQSCQRLTKNKPSHRRGKQGCINQGLKRDTLTRQRMSQAQRDNPSPKRRVPLPVMTPYGAYTSVVEASQSIGISCPGIYYHLRKNPLQWHYID